MLLSETRPNTATQIALAAAERRYAAYGRFELTTTAALKCKSRTQALMVA